MPQTKLLTCGWRFIKWSGAGFSGIRHADQGETEIAMAVGIPVKTDRVKDFQLSKPWYAIRSRFELQPDSGGINGQPSLANPENGRSVREQIVRILGEKVRNIINMEQNPVSEQ